MTCLPPSVQATNDVLDARISMCAIAGEISW